MASSATVKIGVEGAGEFKKNLANITQQSKTLAAEMKATASAFTNEANAEEKNNKVKEILAKQIETQKSKIDKLKQAVEAYTQSEGESGTNTLKYREALAKAEDEMNSLEAEARKLEGGVEDVGNEMSDASDKSLKFGDVLKANVISDAIIGGVKLLAKAVKEVGSAIKDCITESAAFADNILTMSTVTGISTDTLQEWQYMQELTDVSLDTMTGSMTKLIRNMNSAKDGSKTTAAAFEELGISVVDETGNLRNNQDVFYEVIAALGEMENETERDATAMELFGKSAQDLNPIIELGADGMKAFADEAHEMGYVLDGDALGALGKTDDAFQRLKNSGTALKNQIALQLAPTVEKFATGLTNFASKIDFSKGFSGVVEQILRAIPGALDQILGAITSGIEQIQPDASEIISKIIISVTENAPKLLSAGVAIVGGILSGITEAIPTLVDQAPVIIGELIVALAEFGLQLMQSGIEMVIALEMGIISKASEWYQIISEFVTDKIIEPISDWLAKVILKGQEIVQNLADGIKQKVALAKSATQDVVDKIKEKVQEKIDEAKSWGHDLIDGFVQGIKDKIAAVGEAARSIANKVKEFLHFSKPDTGPLREYEKWMPDMMRGLAKGIKSNAYLLENALSEATGKMGVSVGGIGGGGGSTINIYTNEVTPATIDYITAKVNVRLGALA